jgi:hypothetical protein
MSSSEPFINVEIGGIQQDTQGIQLSMRHVGRFNFPPDFPLDHLETARNDLELIAAKLRESPDRMQDLLRAVVSGRNTEVRQLTQELGLRESDFQEQGGGIFWAVVVVGVLCCAGAAY